MQIFNNVQLRSFFRNKIFKKIKSFEVWVALQKMIMQLVIIKFNLNLFLKLKKNRKRLVRFDCTQLNSNFNKNRTNKDSIASLK